MNLDSNNPFASINMRFVYLKDKDSFLEVGVGTNEPPPEEWYALSRSKSTAITNALVELLQKAVKLHAIREVVIDGPLYVDGVLIGTRS